jgi:hypothetical protein
MKITADFLCRQPQDRILFDIQLSVLAVVILLHIITSMMYLNPNVAPTSQYRAPAMLVLRAVGDLKVQVSGGL